MVFAFVPMLTARKGAERTALFLQAERGSSSAVFAAIAAAVILARRG